MHQLQRKCCIKKATRNFIHYLDYDSNKNVLLIDELENGQIVLIDFLHEDCFDTDEKSTILKISKTKDKLKADFNGNGYVLTAEQVKFLREFEIELRSNHKSGSSTIEKYGIYNPKTYNSYAMVDGSA